MTRKRHSVRLTFVWLVAACFILSGSMPLYVGAAHRNGVKTVTVTGSSPISDRGPAAAREQAIAKSLDAAVDQVVAAEISTDILAGRAGAIKAALSGKTQRFIEHYKVLEASESDDRYQATVEVTVSVLQIKKELNSAGILLDVQTLPKVLLLTSQQNLDDVVPQYWWSGTAQESELVAENAIIKELKEEGFFIIISRDSMVRTTAASKRYTPNLDNQEAADLGSRTGADVVVVGQSAVQVAPNDDVGETSRSYKATSSLRALRVDSVMQLAAATEKFVAEGSDDLAGGRRALAGAGAAVGKALAAQLHSAWLTDEKAASFVRVAVEGTRALANFVRFRKILKETHGVNEIRIELLKPNSAEIAVGFDGNAEALARALMAKAYGSFSINIYEITRKGLRLQLIGATAASASQ